MCMRPEKIFSLKICFFPRSEVERWVKASTRSTALELLYKSKQVQNADTGTSTIHRFNPGTRLRLAI